MHVSSPRMRTIFSVTALTFGALFAITAITMVLLTAYLHRTATYLNLTVDTITRASNLRADLLEHNREIHIGLLEPRLRNQQNQASLVDDIRDNFRLALNDVRTPEERALLHGAQRDTETYLVRAGQAVAGGGNAELTLSRYVDSAQNKLRRLAELNWARAQQLSAQADRWDQFSNLFVISTLILMLGLLVYLGAGFRRWFYIPLTRMRQVILAANQSGSTEQVPESGPREVRDIVSAYNDLISALQASRERQLHFLSGVAHDLRNPLAAMKGFIQLLQLDPAVALDKKRSHAYDMLDRQVDRLNRLVGDLLDASRIESGRLEMQLVETDIRKVVIDTAHLYQQSTTRHPVTVTTPEDEVELVCDPDRISQVIQNLMSNAVKYSPQGGAVEIGLRNGRDEVLIFVRDSGIGIPAKDQPRIFEPFGRLPATKDVFPGLGLGLSVTKKIVAAHGGRIEVESQEGVGSEFRVYLPKGIALAQREGPEGPTEELPQEQRRPAFPH